MRAFKAWIKSSTGPFLRPTVLVALVALAPMLFACAPTAQRSGQLAPIERISQFEPGASRSSIELVLGTPFTVTKFEGFNAYYQAETRKARAFLSSKIEERTILAIKYDRDNKMQSYGFYDLDDATDLPILLRRTRSGGSERGLLSQILRARQGRKLR